MKREATFTPRFLDWARLSLVDPSVFEVKHCRGRKSFPLSEFKEHQRNALRAAKHGRFTMKIRDTGYINPFDAVLFTRMQAFLVICYGQEFVLIDIDNVPERGSLTYEAAKKIAAFAATF